MTRALRPALVCVAFLIVAAVPSSGTAVVRPGDDVAAAARAHGSVILAPGVHHGFSIDRSASIIGAPGSLVVGEIRVVADDVRLERLTVWGGENAITVRDVDDARIEDVTILGAALHGVEVNDASVVIRRCSIGGLRDPFAQGIEIRNVVDRSGSLVEGCVVTGGQEGIVSHAARVEYRGNVVRGTTMRALAVTEMSEGLVRGNRVEHVVGSGLYCGDMSHCEFSGNVVQGVRSDGTGIRTTSGYGVVAWYYSTLRDDSVVLDADGPTRGVFLGSTVTDRFPLGTWPGGWSAAIPGMAVTAATIAGLFAVAVVLRPIAHRLPAPSDGGARAGTLLLWGFAVQSFHMLEHGVQVVQAKVVNGRERQGLLGAHVDAEWMHLAYNAVVLLFLVWALAAAVPRVLPRARSILLAATIVQAYHLVEHGFKVAQHAATGAKPTPGLVGGRLGDLVWFHFGINAVVYAGLLVVVVVIVHHRLRSSPRAVPAPAAA